MLVYSVVNCSVVSNSLQPVRLLCLWTSPGKNIGVGCHALLPEIFSTQGLNPGLPNCRRNLYCLSHQGSLRIYEPLEAGYTGETALIHRFFTFSSTVCVCVCVCVCACARGHSGAPTLCGPMDYGPPGSSAQGTLQARMPEWVAISLSRGSSRPRDQSRVSYMSCSGSRILYLERLDLNSSSRKYSVYSMAQN